MKTSVKKGNKKCTIITFDRKYGQYVTATEHEDALVFLRINKGKALNRAVLKVDGDKFTLKVDKVNVGVIPYIFMEKIFEDNLDICFSDDFYYPEVNKRAMRALSSWYNKVTGKKFKDGNWFDDEGYVNIHKFIVSTCSHLGSLFPNSSIIKKNSNYPQHIIDLFLNAKSLDDLALKVFGVAGKRAKKVLLNCENIYETIMNVSLLMNFTDRHFIYELYSRDGEVEDESDFYARKHWCRPSAVVKELYARSEVDFNSTIEKLKKFVLNKKKKLKASIVSNLVNGSRYYEIQDTISMEEKLNGVEDVDGNEIIIDMDYVSKNFTLNGYHDFLASKLKDLKNNYKVTNPDWITALKDLSKSITRKIKNGNEVKEEEITYTFLLPNKKVDIIKWGESMKNCIGSYDPTDTRALVAILVNGEMKYNLEIQKGNYYSKDDKLRMRQFYGKRNSSPDQKEKNDVMKIFAEKGLEFV